MSGEEKKERREKESRPVLSGTQLKMEFQDSGTAAYAVKGGGFQNRYYVVSSKGTRRLLNQPEVVGFEVYTCLLKATSRMMRHFSEKGWVTSANILSILRGALNYPLEESCYKEGVRIHDISFLSSERVFHHDEIAGLEIKYSKLATVPDSTLLIGDIVATGDTLVHCLRYVTENYRRHGAKLRNIILFTIGGDTGITVMENLTAEIRSFWPEFEGFIAVFYEGIFSTYTTKGASGINLPDVDFYWKDGVVAPEYRKETLKKRDTLFEKCIIYDGGARRYEISDHIDEVMEYWNGILERAGDIDKMALLEEKLGHKVPIAFEDWVRENHYGQLKKETNKKLYAQEKAYIKQLKDVPLKVIASTRIMEITAALSRYIRH